MSVRWIPNSLGAIPAGCWSAPGFKECHAKAHAKAQKVLVDGSGVTWTKDNYPYGSEQFVKDFNDTVEEFVKTDCLQLCPKTSTSSTTSTTTTTTDTTTKKTTTNYGVLIGALALTIGAAIIVAGRQKALEQNPQPGVVKSSRYVLTDTYGRTIKRTSSLDAALNAAVNHQNKTRDSNWSIYDRVSRRIVDSGVWT